MKLSVYIAMLKRLQTLYGDLNVFTIIGNGVFPPPDPAKRALASRIGNERYYRFYIGDDSMSARKPIQDVIKV